MSKETPRPGSFFDALMEAQTKVASKPPQQLKPSELDQARMSRSIDLVRIPNKGLGYIANKSIPAKIILISDMPGLLGPPPYRISNAYLEGKEAGDAAIASMAAELATMLKAHSKLVQRAILTFRNALPGGHPLIGIYRSNALPLYKDGNASGGLFSAACRVNHSCAPNCTAYWDEAAGRMIIRTIRAVRKGEEITITYTDAFTSPERQRILLDEYGFKCTCEFCTLGGQEQEDSDGDRNFIENSIQYLPEMGDIHPLHALDGVYFAISCIAAQRLPWLKAIVYNIGFEIAAAWGDKLRAVHLANKTADEYELIAGNECSDEMRMRAYAKDPTTFVGWAKNGTSYPTNPPLLPPISFVKATNPYTARYDPRSIGFLSGREVPDPLLLAAMKDPVLMEAYLEVAPQCIPGFVETAEMRAVIATTTKKKATKKKKKKRRADTVHEVEVANEANDVDDHASVEDEGESLPPYSNPPTVDIQATDESSADQVIEGIDLVSQDQKDSVGDDVFIEAQEPPPLAVDEIHPTSSQQDDVEDSLCSSGGQQNASNPSGIRTDLQAPLTAKIVLSPTIDPLGIPQGGTPLPKENAFGLTHTWTLYHDCRVRKHTNASLKPSSRTYAANLMAIGQFNSVEGFCRYFNWLKRPSELDMGVSYHLFRSGIKPVWEDPMNENGGAWVLNIRSRPQLLDQTWLWLVMALVGEQLDDNDEICGAVVSLRKVDRIQVWVRSRDNAEQITTLERKLLQLLEITPGLFGVHFEFQPHSNDRLPSHKTTTLIPPSTIGRR